MGKTGRRYIDIVIAPEDRARTLSFRIRVGHFYALAVAASIAFVGLVALVMNQAMDEAKLTELNFLRHQNGELRKKVERIAAVEKKITELEVVEDKLMVMAGERTAARELAPVSVDASGKGGAVKPTSIADGLNQFHQLLNAKRGITLAAPAGDPVSVGWRARGFGEAGLEGTSFHPGIDVAVPEGTPVTATAPGIVVFAGNDPVYGKLVIVQHGYTGYSTFYGHNRDLRVKTGAAVKRGDVIAFSGNSGKSSAPHLHYEIRLHGVPVNPAKYMTVAEGGAAEETPLMPPTAAPTAAPGTALKPKAGTAAKKPPVTPAPTSAIPPGGGGGETPPK